MNTVNSDEKFLNTFYTHIVCRLLFGIIATMVTTPLILSFLFMIFKATHEDIYRMLIPVIIATILIIKLLNFCVKIITQKIIVTRQHVLVNSGLINKKSMEITPKKIESITIKQGLLGQLFNFGNIEIKGLGGTLDIINFMYSPFYIKEMIQKLIIQDSLNHVK